MFRRPIVLVLVAVIALAAAAGAQSGKNKATKSNPRLAQEPLTVAPSIYRLVLENERVRVLEARFEPGAKVGPLTQPDHVAVVTSAGTLEVTTAEGTREIDAKVGDAFYFPAETRSAHNVGTTVFACVVTELKGKYKAKGQASPPPGTVDVQQGKVDG